MLKITKLTDYAIVVLTRMAQAADQGWTARGAASTTGLPLPSVSKILKNLARSGVVTSARGAQGGYRLARRPALVTVADIIDAVEGPISLTDCSTGSHADSCEYSGSCAAETNWSRINLTIRQALAGISLEEMASAHTPPLITLSRKPASSLPTKAG